MTVGRDYARIQADEALQTEADRRTANEDEAKSHGRQVGLYLSGLRETAPSMEPDAELALVTEYIDCEFGGCGCEGEGA